MWSGWFGGLDLWVNSPRDLTKAVRFRKVKPMIEPQELLYAIEALRSGAKSAEAEAHRLNDAGDVDGAREALRKSYRLYDLATDLSIGRIVFHMP